MSNRLARLFLALCIAIVFTGRMETAAAHCRGLADAMQAKPATSMTDIDMQGMDMSACHDAPAAQHPAHHAPANGGPCECLAMLIACPLGLEAARTSIRIEPFSWALPEPVRFASVDPAPGLRPPQA
jgi:hypothetical protein